MMSNHVPSNEIKTYPNGDITITVRSTAKDTIKELAREYAKPCIMVIGPDCATKTVVIEHFINDYHCMVGGDPAWLLNVSAGFAKDYYTTQGNEILLFDVRETEVTSREKRNLMVKKLTEIGFSDVVGIYIDNSAYLGDGAEIAKKLLDRYREADEAVGEGLPDDFSDDDRAFIERITQAIKHPADMNEESRKVCEILANDPPTYAEFSGGLIKMKPSWTYLIA